MFLFKSITSRIIFLHVAAIVITSAFMPIALYLLLKSSPKTCSTGRCAKRPI